MLLCSQIKAQDFLSDFSYLRYSCAMGDSVVKTTVWPGENFQNHDISWCKGEEINFENQSVPDSIQKIFVQLIKTTMGDEAVHHIKLHSISSYNDPLKESMDSSILEYYPVCKKIRFKYDCVIHFEDSLLFPLEILTDASGKILNPEDIPKNLKEKKSYQLLSPCAVFALASADNYVKKEGLWNSGIGLHYSNRLQLFYYEIQARSDDEPMVDDSYAIYKNKYIFLDAVSGKVLWRTSAYYYVGHGECPKPYTVFPENSLQD